MFGFAQVAVICQFAYTTALSPFVGYSNWGSGGSGSRGVEMIAYTHHANNDMLLCYVTFVANIVNFC